MSDAFDDILKQKLEGYELPPPMHLWEGIARKRNWRHRLPLNVRRRWPLLVLFIMVLGAFIHNLSFNQSALSFDELGSFPIVEEPGSPIASSGSQGISIDTKAPVSSAALKEKKAISFAEEKERAPLDRGNVLPGNKRDNASSRFNLQSIIIEELPLQNSFTPEQRKVKQPEIQKPGSTQELVLPEVSLAVRNETEMFSLLPGLEASLTMPERPLSTRSIQPIRKLSPSLSVELLNGVHYSFRALDAGSRDGQDYLNLRKATESVRLGYTAALRTEIGFSGGWRLQAGLRYNLINEKFAYENENERRLEDKIDIYDSNNVLLRSDSVFIEGYRQKVSYNRYNLLDFTLAAGYEKSIGQFAVGLYFGPSFNFSFQKKVDLISPVDHLPVNFIDLEEKETPVFRSTLGVSWISNLKISYRPVSDIGVFVEPYFHYLPRSFTTPEFTIRQSYHNIGLSLGLRKYLNR